MPTSLRRACHACIVAKRRCQPQLPQCSRCLEKSIPCTYDLEPLAEASPFIQPASQGFKPHDDQQTPSQHHQQSSFAIFDNAASAQQAAIRGMQLESQGVTPPELRMVAADQELIPWFVGQIMQIPDVIIRNKSSPFVHAQLYQEDADSLARMQHISRLYKSTSRTSAEEVILLPSKNVQLQQLTSIDIRHLPPSGILKAVHELALYLTIYLGNNLPARYESEVQQYPDLLVGWIEYLWTATKDPSNHDSSQWHSWLVAESARRSIIACHFIKAAISIIRSGYCLYVPFLESVPFDTRMGVWEATSEDSWQSAVTKHGGQPEVLTSFREFIESSQDLSHIREEGVFQKILLMLFYGKRARQAMESA